MTEYKIKDLRVGMKDVDITVEIDFLGEKRRTSGFDNENLVPAIVTDETGEIQMTFWNDDIKKAKPGLKVRVEGGYVSAYNGQLQLRNTKENKVIFL